MQEFRIYYECLEQAEHFVLPIVSHYTDCPVLLIKRSKDFSVYGKNLEQIIFWKDPDILISVVKNGVEFPLIQIEFSTAEFTADHEYQRYDGIIASAKCNCIYVKISPSKSKKVKKKHGGDSKFDHMTSYATIYQQYQMLSYHFEWKAENENLLVNPDFLSCPTENKEFSILLSELLKFISANEVDSLWLFTFQSLICSNYEWFGKWKQKIETTELTDFTQLKSSRTKWNYTNKNLCLKINRFGHAMDPERGMLAYFGSRCETISKMFFSTTSKEWYADISKTDEIDSFIKETNLMYVSDLLTVLQLGSGLHRYDEFKEIVKIYKTSQSKSATIDISMFVRKCFFRLNKQLKTIFYFTSHWLIESENASISLIWDDIRSIVVFPDKFLVTPLQINSSIGEDEVTYISIHNILRKNNYKLVAASYPGSQGDRAILPEKSRGRKQKRIFVDVVAYLPEKHTNLQENKANFSKEKIQTDIDKLSLYKTNETYQIALETFLQKYDGNSPRNIKIGVGFWANKNFKVQDILELTLDSLDYFVYINSEKTRWKIFSTGKEQLFEITEGDINLPEIYQINKNFDNQQKRLF